jgi:group II intron reverse transcriptase/maturase
VDELKSSSKPFDISKWRVWEAWEKVKANKGAPGMDSCSIEDFEKDLQNNLFRIWNRMSSGSYFPPPVKAVEIPKSHGGEVRILGVPTVADRVAQTVVAMHLEPNVEPVFHADSYGYRPKRSALDAVERCWGRCWKTDWVLDLDIEKFFDSVPHATALHAFRVRAKDSATVSSILSAGRQSTTSPVPLKSCRPDGARSPLREHIAPAQRASSCLRTGLADHAQVPFRLFRWDHFGTSTSAGGIPG